MNQDPQSPFVVKNDVSYNVLKEVKENIQPHDEFLHKKENNCYSKLKSQIFPPPPHRRRNKFSSKHATILKIFT